MSYISYDRHNQSQINTLVFGYVRQSLCQSPFGVLNVY